jgi:hypothetical protein
MLGLFNFQSHLSLGFLNLGFLSISKEFQFLYYSDIRNIINNSGQQRNMRLMMKPTLDVLLHAFRGCPHRKACTYFLVESKTCINGPYEYCGQYRAAVEKRAKESVLI